MKKIALANLPYAKVRTHKVADTTYVGANPEYVPYQPPTGGPVTWVKTAKGLPFRKQA